MSFLSTDKFQRRAPKSVDSYLRKSLIKPRDGEVEVASPSPSLAATPDDKGGDGKGSHRQQSTASSAAGKEAAAEAEAKGLDLTKGLEANEAKVDEGNSVKNASEGVATQLDNITTPRGPTTSNGRVREEGEGEGEGNEGRKGGPTSADSPQRAVVRDSSSSPPSAQASVVSASVTMTPSAEEDEWMEVNEGGNIFYFNKVSEHRPHRIISRVAG